MNRIARIATAAVAAVSFGAAWPAAILCGPAGAQTLPWQGLSNPNGLVDYVVDDDAVVAEAGKIARELASGPTEAYGGIKRLFLETLNRSLESQLEDEAQTLAAISRTADAQEGVKAFREKRKPKFAGK